MFGMQRPIPVIAIHYQQQRNTTISQSLGITDFTTGHSQLRGVNCQCLLAMVTLPLKSPVTDFLM